MQQVSQALTKNQNFSAFLLLFTKSYASQMRPQPCLIGNIQNIQITGFVRKPTNKCTILDIPIALIFSGKCFSSFDT